MQPLTPLHAAPISHTMAIQPDPAVEPDYLALPDAPAVCIFESDCGGTVHIATTASARDLARRRLAPTPVEQRTSRTDLRAVCSGGCVHAIRVGSSLEADAVYLHQARERLPHLAKVVAERWRSWFVHVDPAAAFPQWTKTNLIIGLVGKRSASTAIGASELPPGILLGPLPDKDAAGRLIESITDCFDLCRYHHLLVLAPNAAACAYKEMGRCPAPCDGSETMNEYRSRSARACAVVVRVSEHAADMEDRIRALGAEQRFEDAATAQRELARLRTLDKPAFAQLRVLHEWTELLVLSAPSPRKGIATVALFDRGSLLRLGELDTGANDSMSAAEHLAASALFARPRQPSEPVSLDAHAVETIGLVSRWLFAPKAKRKGAVLPLRNGRFESAELHAAATALSRAKAMDIQVDTHEIEGT